MKTCRALVSGTAETGMVMFAKAEVPALPVAVKLIELELLEKAERMASERTNAEHPVAQPSGPNVDVMLNWTVTERLKGPPLPVTVTV